MQAIWGMRGAWAIHHAIASGIYVLSASHMRMLGALRACTEPCHHIHTFMCCEQVWDPAPLAYLHIDCDLFVGAHDALTLLSHKIVPGTVLLFDELINYNRFADNEVGFLVSIASSGACLVSVPQQCL